MFAEGPHKRRYEEQSIHIRRLMEEGPPHKRRKMNIEESSSASLSQEELDQSDLFLTDLEDKEESRGNKEPNHASLSQEESSESALFLTDFEDNDGSGSGSIEEDDDSRNGSNEEGDEEGSSGSDEEERDHGITKGKPVMEDVASLSSGHAEEEDETGEIIIVAGGVSQKDVEKILREDPEGRLRYVRQQQKLRHEAMIQRLYYDALPDKDKTEEELAGIHEWGDDPGANWVLVNDNNEEVVEDEEVEDEEVEDEDTTEDEMDVDDGA